jgi:hypothetical protein
MKKKPSIRHLTDGEMRAAAFTQQQGLIPAEQEPSGNRGKKRLKTAFGYRDLIVRDKQFCAAQASFDWYNDKLQILVFDKDDEPALHVRYKKDGTIAEILIRDDLMKSPWGYAGPIVKKESSLEPSQWQKERDGE